MSVVSDVFTTVASKYDIMNDIMSFKTHILWKTSFVDSINIKNGMNILDLSSGSGDIALLLLKKAQKLGVDIKITISDFNQEMLDLAKNRTDFNFYKDKITFLKLDACNLHSNTHSSFNAIEQNAYDIITCSFGARNFHSIEDAINQIFLSLKAGGSFYCLEFNPPQDNLFGKFYNFYSTNVIPKIGKIISGSEESYIYLANSINSFLKPNEFVSLLAKSNYKNSFYSNIFMGIVAMYYGSR